VLKITGDDVATALLENTATRVKLNVTPGSKLPKTKEFVPVTLTE